MPQSYYLLFVVAMSIAFAPIRTQRLARMPVIGSGGNGNNSTNSTAGVGAGGNDNSIRGGYGGGYGGGHGGGYGGSHGGGHGGGGSGSGNHGSQGSSNRGPKELELLYQWKELEFEFPSHHDRMYALNKGLYVPGNGVPIDVDVHYSENHNRRVFVTIPRFTTGIPITLATIKNTNSGPILRAYPEYSVHSSHGRDCDGITSVFRVAIDECNRMWVVDTGRVGSTQYCPPQILVFDLRMDVLIHRYRVPESQFKSGVSLFITPIVDVRDPPPTGTCRKTKVYISDVSAFGILIYDFLKNTSWRAQNKLMYPDPDYGTFTIAGESFDLMDGILGMDISPRHIKGERYLFFHSLASSVENVVSLRILDNRTMWEENVEAEPRAFKTIGNRRVQSGAEAMDSKGNLFFGVMEPIALAYWNINNPRYDANSIKIVSRNDETLQFASGVKVKRNGHGKEEIWVSTNRFQKVAAGTKNSNETNFRIQRCLLDDLLSPTGNPCRNRNYNQLYDTTKNLIFT